MDNVTPTSPLNADWRDSSAARIRETGIEVREQPGRRKLIYTTDGSDAALRAAVVNLGAPLPDGPDATTGDDPCCHWLGPHRWLIAYEATPDLGHRMAQATAGVAASMVDVSHAWVSVLMSGARAHTLLTRGCELDLHQRVFGRGRFSTTGIARVPVMIHARNSGGGYEILVDRSLAVDLWVWLKKTARDLGE